MSFYDTPRPDSIHPFFWGLLTAAVLGPFFLGPALLIANTLGALQYFEAKLFAGIFALPGLAAFGFLAWRMRATDSGWGPFVFAHVLLFPLSLGLFFAFGD